MSRDIEQEVLLRPLTPQVVELAGIWRMGVRESLRSVQMKTDEEQHSFYHHPPAGSRWWGLYHQNSVRVLGMGGLTGIQWENGLAEISLLLDPAARGQGVGREAVRSLLIEAFHRMRLNQVVGECYACSPALPFWQGLVQEWNGGAVALPSRKWWDGQWWGSYSFWWLASFTGDLLRPVPEVVVEAPPEAAQGVPDGK